MTSEPLTIASTDGLSLEAALDDPGIPKAALVFCHPHPRMGGTMNAPLLAAVRDHLVGRRWAVLRFNFRGIGRSEGEPTLGTAEVADATGAVAAARALFSGLPVAIAGWSFGGAVAVRAAAADDSLAGCVGIAPAVEAKPDVSAGLPDPHELDLGVPVLFVCGSNDEEVSPAACRRWVESFDYGTYVELEAANHFFWGRYERLSRIVGEWLDDLV